MGLPGLLHTFSTSLVGAHVLILRRASHKVLSLFQSAHVCVFFFFVCVCVCGDPLNKLVSVTVQTLWTIKAPSIVPLSYRVQATVNIVNSISQPQDGHIGFLTVVILWALLEALFLAKFLDRSLTSP